MSAYDGEDGDTVEGDLGMDLDAMENAKADDGEGRGLATPVSGSSGDDAAGELARDSEVRTGSAPGETADGASRQAENGDDEDDVEELDLADPTESDNEADERADWDIPGR